ncbi:hypothetical protein IZ6_24900 [Terrihabitans soli]|uniref:Peptidase M15C domain-containing protein n=1 Tax=Terrihabitans soli TaxID=708113 RepID=A0A6S6QW01_9HYPH|nr:peptidoglycan-binding domain-containing protein [Terrihabitans soli]BCJ91755.1 hypothetical protein IZ6_24900 [Terrihabitans soli]
MTLLEIQTLLAKAGFYKGDLDGKWGPKTAAAIALLPGVDKAWVKTRLLVAATQALLHIEGIDAGAVDGRIGPQTRYALEVWAARQKGPKAEKAVTTWRDKEPPMRAGTEKWPVQSGAAAFFGAPGENHTLIDTAYPMVLAWDLKAQVTKITCNKKVAEPLKRIFSKTLAHYGIDQIRNLRLDRFGGCFNNRKMRGGSSLSVHAFAAAVDIDPSNNQLKWTKERATLARPEFLPFWGFVEEEGAVSLGRARNYDWMHFQFVRLGA